MIAQIKKQVTTQQIIYLLAIAGLSFVFTGLFLIGNSYNNKLFPNTYINNMNISGLSLLEAINTLEKTESISTEIEETDSTKINSLKIKPHEFILNIDDISLASSSADLGYTTDFTKAVDEAYSKQHKNHPIINSFNALLAFIKKDESTAPNKYDENKLENFLVEFNKKIQLVGENPYVSLKISNSANSIIVFPGSAGRELNNKTTAENILTALQDDKHTVTAKIASTSSVLNKEEVNTTIDRASKFVGLELTMVAEDKKFYLNDKELVELINPVNKYKTNCEKNNCDNENTNYNIDKITELVDGWAEKINRPAQNAVFEYNEDNLKVEDFLPHRDGLELDVDSSYELLKNWLVGVEKEDVFEFGGEGEDDNGSSGDESGGGESEDVGGNASENEGEDEGKSENKNSTENSLAKNNNQTKNLLLTLNKTKPEIKLDKTNELGINKRIGFGESYYHHSIPNRIYNVGITAERLSYTIVPPGKEFSFNKTIGEISRRTGYRSAYIISEGKTVLGDGGGVCQVSSTLFRSVLDAGLDVSKRLQHSYRVSYYELNSQPGFDATVYAGEVDFRFINDTPGHVILLTYNNPEDLYMNIEIYGTDDGRTSEIHDYKKWGQVGPPANEYYPTPDLPTGITRQVDWSVSGIKAEFTNTVRDIDGEILHDDTYYSNYRPWSAKFLVGI